MSKSKQLYDALKRISIPAGDIMPGVVKQVQDDSIDVDVNGVMYYDVRLQAITGAESGLKAIPKVDSVVLFQRIGNSSSNEFYVCQFAEVTELRFEIGNTLFVQDDSGFQMSKDSDSLKKIITDLVSEILQIHAPMNTGAIIDIQQRINQLLR